MNFLGERIHVKVVEGAHEPKPMHEFMHSCYKVVGELKASKVFLRIDLQFTWLETAVPKPKILKAGL